MRGDQPDAGEIVVSAAPVDAPDDTATAVAEASLSSGDNSSGDTPEPPARRSDSLVGVLLVTTVVLFVATVLLGLMAFAPRLAPIKSGPTRLAEQALEEQEIIAVAERFAKNFLTIDYRTIDADTRRLTADATAGFKDEIAEVLKRSRSGFEKEETTLEGEVREAVLLLSEDASARVQVLAERTMRSAGTGDADERSETKVLDISLVKRSQGWKVDDVREVEVSDER